MLPAAQRLLRLQQVTPVGPLFHRLAVFTGDEVLTLTQFPATTKCLEHSDKIQGNVTTRLGPQVLLIHQGTF